MQGALWDARCKWYNIGLQLGIAVDKLDVIRDRNLKNADECFTELLSEWLRQGSPQPTWGSIVAVLCSKAVDMPQVALAIKNEYLLGATEVQRLHSEEYGASSKVESDCVQACAETKVVAYRHIKEFNDLNDSQREQLEQRLIMESEDIRIRFNLLLNKFFDSVEDQNVPVKKLIRYLKGLTALKRIASMESTEECETYIGDLEKINDIEGIRDVVEKHSTFFDYRPLEYMIELCGSKKDKSELERYKNHFENYIKRRVFECPLDIGPVDAADSTRLCVKLESDYTKLIELKQFQCRLSLILNIQVYHLRLISIREGCILLTFLIPNLLQEKIVPLSVQEEIALLEMGVIQLSCGAYHLKREAQELLDNDADSEIKFTREILKSPSVAVIKDKTCTLSEAKNDPEPDLKYFPEEEIMRTTQLTSHEETGLKLIGETVHTTALQTAHQQVQSARSSLEVKHLEVCANQSVEEQRKLSYRPPENKFFASRLEHLESEEGIHPTISNHEESFTKKVKDYLAHMFSSRFQWHYQQRRQSSSASVELSSFPGSPIFSTHARKEGEPGNKASIELHQVMAKVHKHPDYKGLDDKQIQEQAENLTSLEYLRNKFSAFNEHHIEDILSSEADTCVNEHEAAATTAVVRTAKISNINVKLQLRKLKVWNQGVISRFLSLLGNEYGPTHAVLLIGNKENGYVMLEWNGTSLIDPQYYHPQSSEGIVFEANIATLISTMDRQLHEEVRIAGQQQDYEKHTNIVFDTAMERSKMFDDLFELVIKYNKYYSYHMFSRNCQHFVADAMKVLKIQNPHPFTGRLKTYFDKLKKGLTAVNFQTHSQLDAHVQTRIIEATQQELEYYMCMYLHFHAIGQSQSSKHYPTKWKCEEAECQFENVDARITEQQSLLNCFLLQSVS